MKKLAKRFMIFGLGLVLFSFIFLRTPNIYYTEVGDHLVPIDPRVVAGLQQGPYGGQPQAPYRGNGGYGGQPYYNQPGYSQPGYSQPGYSQPGYNQSGYNQPYYNQASYTQYTASPYVPPTQGYSPPPSYSQNRQEAMHNPRMQSNYRTQPSNSQPDL